MPANFIGEVFLRLILELVFEVVLYYVGRIVVPLFTLGRVKCDHFTAGTPRRKLKWDGLFHRQEGQVYLTPEATAFVGLLSIGALVLCGILYFHFKDR